MQKESPARIFLWKIQTSVTFPETGNTTPRQKGDCGVFAKLNKFIFATRGEKWA